MPQDKEVEEAVLGALMLEKDAYTTVCDILKPECFYEPRNQRIYEAIHLDTGILEIYHSKGYKDRVVYMSRDVCSLCADFHRYYDSVLPGRRYFFQPGMEKEHYTKMDIDNAFGRIRSRMVSCPKKGKLPTAHGLRHLFAVENVRMCMEQGEDFNNWIQYLSQYMGHRKLRDTLYYIHMTSRLFPSYKDKLGRLTEGIGVRYAEE